MNRDQRVSQGELQQLIEDLRRLRQRMAEELERRAVAGHGPEDEEEAVLSEKEKVP